MTDPMPGRSIRTLEELTNERCPKCQGCGRIANSDDGEPWTVWENLPVKSAAAIFMGLVKPIVCPACHGTGKRQEKNE